MTLITLSTTINAPIEIVFNLSRDIDFHLASASKTNEKVIAGRSSGLIELDETVTWKGKHFGLFLTHKSLISQFDYPNSFTDEMVEGNFKKFKHTHKFSRLGKHTIMEDYLEYSLPLWVLGQFVDWTLVKKHLTNFLNIRNDAITKKAESMDQYQIMP